MRKSLKMRLIVCFELVFRRVMYRIKSVRLALVRSEAGTDNDDAEGDDEDGNVAEAEKGEDTSQTSPRLGYVDCLHTNPEPVCLAGKRETLARACIVQNVNQDFLFVTNFRKLFAFERFGNVEWEFVCK